jgi:hypothetical protein
LHAAGDGLVVNRFDGHPNGWANALATEAVLETFGPLWQAAAEAKRLGAVWKKLVAPYQRSKPLGKAADPTMATPSLPGP